MPRTDGFYLNMQVYTLTEKIPSFVTCNLDSEGNRSDGKRCYLHHTHRYEDKSYF